MEGAPTEGQPTEGQPTEGQSAGADRYGAATRVEIGSTFQPRSSTRAQ
jgi:hypothetical protein